ncbi:MAG: type II toxin-antitoxin system RelE/ParE family toxin [Chthoniobacterales bacterium]
MKYEFHPEALAEFDSAAAFYADRQQGLEVRFINAVEMAISRICDAPERWNRFDGDIRRYLVHVFPYAVLYSVEGDLIYILAVMHCARKPDYWKTRQTI